MTANKLILFGSQTRRDKTYNLNIKFVIICITVVINVVVNFLICKLQGLTNENKYTCKMGLQLVYVTKIYPIKIC
jgi:type III secretory pathway component EscS